MATRLKTVEYWFPLLATAADNTDTNFTQITVDLPENSKVFKKVVFDVVYADVNTTLTGTNNRRQVSIQLGAAGYSAVNNTNVYTLSGENFVGSHSGDFTSYFAANWSGTSMTCDARFLYDMSTATPLGARNLSGRLRITYEYDDTSTTHVKTVWIPLNAPVAQFSTTKPGAATAIIPALDTELPETSKSILQTAVVVQGNTNTSGATDVSVSIEIDTDGAITTGLYEMGGTQAMFYRFNQNVSFATNAAHNFFLWSGVSVTWGYHTQAWLVVTYTFNASTSTSVFNSLILPMEFDSPMGAAAADWQRATRSLFVEEPATITTKQIAFFAFWDQVTALSGLNWRVGTGSFIAYGDLAGVVAGSNAAMIRNDSAFTLARGENTLQADVYRSGANMGWNISGFWIVNYTSSKASAGVGAHNHTVFWSLKGHGTDAAATERVIAATAPEIPETSYFLNAVGTYTEYVSNSTLNLIGVTVQVERLAAEGGVQWESAYRDINQTDPETGLRYAWSQIRELFKRWPGDPSAGRMDLETARRWRVIFPNTAITASGFFETALIFTYHSITFEFGGEVSGSGGGTVNIDLHRATSGEKVLSTSRSGNGAYLFSWYDNVASMFAQAREDATHLGRSDDKVAA
jgi:hypothetical protein